LTFATDAGPSVLRNLLIVHTSGAQQLSDWLKVKEIIGGRAPDIEVGIATNGQANSVTRRWQVRRPSLVFSPVFLSGYKPRGGTVYAGRDMAKFEELKRLTDAGLPVPRWVKLTPDLVLSTEDWGEFVITKPERGLRGLGVRLVRTEMLAALHDALTRNGHDRVIVQEYVENLDDRGHPCEHRVLTMFGRPLYSVTQCEDDVRSPLADIADHADGSITPGQLFGGGTSTDAEVLDFASRVASAMKEIPCLGIDILRDRRTGILRILETNPSGRVWHFSSDLALRQASREQREAKFRQFDALNLAADLLIAKTRAEAI
jgi:hypothetical protein